MTALPVPSRERVLRGVFWKLLFRGPAALQGQSDRRRRRLGLKATIVTYALFGLLPAMSAFVLDPLAFASALHACTFLFASLTLASSAGTMLFVREEAEILLHRPVRAEEMLRAKAFVLVGFSLLLATALNAAGLVTGLWNKGNSWWFPFTHLFVTLLLMLFSAAAVVLVYNLCLRWFGRERFENLLATVQVLLVIAMVVGTQMMPRLMDTDTMRQLDLSRGWALLVPPVWFGALDALACAAAPIEQVWLPAAIGLCATALLVWAAFGRLGSAYGLGLMAMGEVTAAPARSRSRLLPLLLRTPPLRWWLADPVQRQSFLLASAYLVRDRETKLKVYPSLVPLLVMPIVMAVGPSRDRGPTAMSLDALVVGYAAIIPIQAMNLLRHSGHWRAADLFRVAPVRHWAPLFEGARKAVLFWLVFPSLALLAAILAAIRGAVSPFAMILPTAVCATVCSMVPGLLAEWLPLSRPNEPQRDAATGCVTFGLVLLVAMGLGGLGAWMDEVGWFWPFLAVTTAVGLGLQQVFRRQITGRRFRPAVH